MKKVLFICLGNICRSPAAEGILKSLIHKKHLSERIKVDSAGMLYYHTGEHPDPRMIKHALDRGYHLDHKARQFNPNKDFKEFDYIITMDDSNYRDIKKLDKENRYAGKIHKMVEYSSKKVKSVPDPYEGGPEGFEKVLDILEDACSNFLDKMKDES
jgi:protein-tyrosine phosphatase